MNEPTADLGAGRSQTDGNIFIFCDDLLVADGWQYRCVRGAGHSDSHLYSRPPYPQSPVQLLRAGRSDPQDQTALAARIADAIFGESTSRWPEADKRDLGTWVRSALQERILQALTAVEAARRPEDWQPQIAKVTRFEVIGAGGRELTAWGCSIELSFQDEGRTLKVFLTRNRPADPPRVAAPPPEAEGA